MGTKKGGFNQPTTIGVYDLGLGKQKFDFGTPTGGGASGGGGAATGPSDEDVLSGLIDDMYSRYAPETISYDAKSEDEIRSAVAAWLRPNYDQAIENRKEQTQANKANLDADAIARGMGASTYVTEVKNRQQNAEARDISSLESDYGATLAQYVTQGVDSETDRSIQVQQYNAAQRQNAYDFAYSAALQLFALYKKNSGGGSGKKGTSVTVTSRENCETFLSLLSGNERREVYDATTTAGARYRAELLASVGAAGYVQLMGKYPSTP